MCVARSLCACVYKKTLSILFRTFSMCVFVYRHAVVVACVHCACHGLSQCAVAGTIAPGFPSAQSESTGAMVA